MEIGHPSKICHAFPLELVRWSREMSPRVLLLDPQMSHGGVTMAINLGEVKNS